ncbi:MAG: hypothetical protein ACK2TZ_02775, partial [Anaerolineales bacterium]
MKKITPLLLVFLLVGLLGACQPADQPESTQTAASSPTVQVPTEITAETEDEPVCVPNSPMPTPSPEELAVFTP